MPLPKVLSLHSVSPHILGFIEQIRVCESMTESLAIAEIADLAATANGTDCDRAVTAYLLAFVLYSAGASERAVEAGERALPLLDSQGLYDERITTLRWVSFAAADSSAFSVALRCANLSYELAQTSGELRSRVLALNQLGFCFERSGDLWQGERLLRDSVSLARELGEAGVLMACLNNLAIVLMGKFYAMRGTSAQLEGRASLRLALPMLNEVIALAPPQSEPYMVVCAEANLGEALVHAELLDAAEAVLSTTLAKSTGFGFAAISTRIRCSFAELHLERAEFALAASEFEALLFDEQVLKEVETSQRVHYGRYLAHRGAGELAAALRALEAFRRNERESTFNQLKARSEFLMTRAEVDQNQRQRVAQACDTASERAKAL
jgi:hypothetical protein